MAKSSILDPQQNYTFSKFFELNADPEEIFAELGCSLQSHSLHLPRYERGLDFLDNLQRRLERSLELVDLTTEIARREVLVAPILFEVCNQCSQKLKLEYAVSVSNWLKGTFDYFIPAPQNLLVIEAKQADLAKGFVQLGAELIALDQWTNSTMSLLYGAVTTGDAWKFGIFDRNQRILYRDINLYAIPANLKDLLEILMGIISAISVEDIEN
jgi:hypothetical protein